MGNPAQNFTFAFDTGYSSVILPEENCKGTGCGKRRTKYRTYQLSKYYIL